MRGFSLIRGHDDRAWCVDIKGRARIAMGVNARSWLGVALCDGMVVEVNLCKTYDSI